MYRENEVEIEPTIAGLLCSAILSDTLMFRSPTCTDVDRKTAKKLAKIAKIDITDHATRMFNAGAQLGDKTPDEIFHIDCKNFKVDRKSIAVAQVTSMSQRELDGLKEQMIQYMQNLLPVARLDMLFLMLTNIADESTELLFVGNGTKELVENTFNRECEANSVHLPGVVSRKQQLITPLSAAIKG
jgi:manganese-dependent inorganic pyrophosphatase